MTRHTFPSAPPGFILFLTLISGPLNAVDDFTGLGDLAGGSFSSVALGVSSDGSVVVGQSTSTSGFEAFRWTQAGGMVGLGDLAGGSFFSEARGVSADGSVVVGQSNSTSGPEAFHWTLAGGMVGLGDLAGGSFFSRAFGVNADGSVVVGESLSTSGFEAFRWTQAGGMVGLGDLAGGSFFSRANGVNADGSVVVGLSTSTSGNEAFRWTQAGGMVGIGDLAGGVFDSVAYGVNADGSVVVGQSTSTSGPEAFRWTQAGGGMVGLGDLAGGSFFSGASGVNADGSVVVGFGESASGSEAFRWTQAGGMQSVIDWLLGAGVTVTGWTLSEATGVNADGTVVVGYGASLNGTEAWIARVGFTAGLTTLANLSSSLVSTLPVINVGNYLLNLPFNGAHHRPLLSYHGLTHGRCVWASGDLASYGHKDDGDAGIAEIGGCYDFLPNRLRLGVGVGKSYANQDFRFNGDSDIDGEYVLVELDYALQSAPVTASLTSMYGAWDAVITRGYLNAGTPDFSRGDTDIKVLALRARLDWNNAFTLGNIFFSPRVAWTVDRTEVDGYTETGGGFPAAFNDRNHTSHELRYGIDGEVQVAEATWLRGMVEGIHRFDGNDPTLSGEIIGIINFSFSGQDNSTNWVRVGAEVEHHFSTNALVSASVNGSTEGEDPVVSGGISFKYSY